MTGFCNISKKHITAGSINSVFECWTFNFERPLFKLMYFLCPFILKKNPLVLSPMVIITVLFVNDTFISLLFIFLRDFLTNHVSDIRPLCIIDCQNQVQKFQTNIGTF